MENEVLLETRGITKLFPGVRALNKVDITVKRGEIHGLIGENGSGKSTILYVAAGMHQPDEGEMFFKGKPHQPSTMIEGAALGFGMIVQEAGNIEGLTVAENIFLGEEEKFRGRFGLIDRRAMNKAAGEALAKIGADYIKPGQFIDKMDLESRKLVEVAKVMYYDPEIMVVDETTTALGHKGREIIYRLMQKQKQHNRSVMFISHDLEEVMLHCDTLTVLRDGNLVATLDKSDFHDNKVKQYMVGREISKHYYREDNTCTYNDEVVLHIEELTTGRGELMNFSGDLHKGEILGIGGLSGSGMHELGRALFGEEPVVLGKVVFAQENEEITNARIAIKHEMGYVSKNRDQEALVLTASIKDNIVGTGFDKIEKGVVITPAAEKKYVRQQVESLNIKCSNMNQMTKTLSGGNKQKVVLSKWLARDSKILILDCPTRGVDIGVKATIYQLMEEMKQNGCSIIMISEEMPELIGMCDRIIVLRNGEISGTLTRGVDISESAIIELII